MFVTGFKKIAELQEPGDDSTSAKYLRPAAAGAGAGALTYAGHRMGAKTKLMRTLRTKEPKGRLGRSWDRMLYGADEIGYTPTHGGTKVPKKPKHFAGTVMHEYEGDKRFHKGDKNIGDFKSTKHTKKLEDKMLESRTLNRFVPKHHTVTKGLSGMSEKPLSRTYKKMKGDFIVKPRSGFNSGVGGSAFVTSDDIAQHVTGGKLSKSKQKMISRMKRSPGKFIAQKSLDIKKDPITGHSREIRVHAIGNKVVKGATSPRGGNIVDYTKRRKAEKFFQAALNRMPKSQKPSHMFWAPDIAVTKGGMKIIETNRGAAMSGLMDPKYLASSSGRAAAANSVRINNAIYKHVTGRHTRLSAGLRGAAMAGTVGLGMHYLNKHKKKTSQK